MGGSYPLVIVLVNDRNVRESFGSVYFRRTQNDAA